MFRYHRIIPKKLRTKILAFPFVLKAFKIITSNLTISVLHHGKKFYFNAYNNFGFLTVNLDNIESEQRAFALKYIAKLKLKVAWDIGANIGFWSVFLSNIMGHGCKILSIEPNYKNLLYLKKNTKDLETVVCILNIGVSSFNGIAFLNTDETLAMNSIEINHYTSFTGRDEINCQTIDTIAKREGYPDFVKLDVEGHEYESLLGGLATLSRCKTIWVIEVTDNGSLIIDLLKKTGHTVLNMQGHEIFESAYYLGAIPTPIYQKLQKEEIE